MHTENVASTGANQASAQNFNANDVSTLDDLANKFGLDAASGAVNNVLGFTLGDIVKTVINNSGLPEFMKDAANGAIDSAVADSRAPTSPEAEAETVDAMQQVMDNVRDQATEELEDAAGGQGGRGKAGGGANWLSQLAKAMGDVAGAHLGNAVGLAGRISQLEKIEGTGEEAVAGRQAQATEMAGLQAEMQADTQMFKLAQEATTTIVKSLGEALTSSARKQ